MNLHSAKPVFTGTRSRRKVDDVSKRRQVALLCVTSQQIYCRQAGVRRSSSVHHRSVRKTFFLRNHEANKPNFRENYLSTISQNRFFFRFFFFFVFANMGPYGRKISNNISSESTHQIYSQKSRILIGRVSTKVVQRIVKF